MTEPTTPRRSHRAGARIATVVPVGGRLVADEQPPSWWAPAHTEGDEVGVATTMGRG